MARSTFSILCGLFIFAALAFMLKAQSDECDGICAETEDCKKVQNIPACVCKPGWKRPNNGQPCYWICRNDTDCADDDFCGQDFLCKPR